MSGIERIAAEQRRQREVEGYTAERDAGYWDEDLAVAAACYATPPSRRRLLITAPYDWPWAARSWKPTPENRIRELEKAGALIASEIDRLEARQS